MIKPRILALGSILLRGTGGSWSAFQIWADAINTANGSDASGFDNVEWVLLSFMW